MIPPRSPTPHSSCEFGFFLHMHHMPRMPKAYDVFLQKPSGVLPENVEIIGMGLRRIIQPFQRVDAAYALVIGGRIVVKRQNQFGV